MSPYGHSPAGTTPAHRWRMPDLTSVLSLDKTYGHVLRLIFGMVNSISEWYRTGREQPSTQLADTVSSLAMDGLLPRPTAGPSE
jgi:hypothetical protein